MKELVLISAAMAAMAASAADCNWIGQTDSYWETAANWNKSVIPGTNTDEVTVLDNARFYYGPPYIQDVLLREDRYLGFLSFFQKSATDVGSYTIGTPDGPAIHLMRADGAGTITMFDNATDITVPYVTNTIAAPLRLRGAYQLINNCASPTHILRVGDIAGEAARGNEVQLKGSNVGANELFGVLSNSVYPVDDGNGGTVMTNVAMKLTKLNGGVWHVSGKSTYTGVTTVSVGTLIVDDDVIKGEASPVGIRTESVTAYSAGLTVGYANPNSAAWCLPVALLAGTKKDGTPVTINRYVNMNVNNKQADWPQPSLVGGANTNGTSHFTGTVNCYRPVTFVCSAGGTTSFENGINSRSRAHVVGTPDYTGVVRFATAVNNAEASFAVSNGTFQVDANLTSTVTVAPEGTLTGSAIVKGPVSVEAGGTIAGASSGVLTIEETADHKLALATGAVLRFPAVKRETAPIAVTSVDSEALSLDGVKIEIVEGETNPTGKFPLLTVSAGIADADKIDTSALPTCFSLDVVGETLYGRYDEGIKLFVR